MNVSMLWACACMHRTWRLPTRHAALPWYAEPGKPGRLTLEGVEHRIDVLQLPTVVESYKTYDDTNLVKTKDIGQVGTGLAGE